MGTSSAKKIAIYYPAFMGGGAEAVALWMLEALRDTYDLTLFTVVDLDFDTLNTMYGTHLRADEIQVKTLFPKGLRSPAYAIIANNPYWRMAFFHLLMRQFKEQANQYDLVTSAYNAIDMGQRGWQYIHWVKVMEGQPFHQKISNFSHEQLRENVSVANSQFVANRVKEKYGIDCNVIFPPVLIDAPEVPWDEKENAFICSGRLTKAKQPHKVIQILERVRRQGFDVKLHLTGGGGGAYAWGYQKFLKKLVREHADWVTLYENLKYSDYVKVVAKCKYGFHYKQEPFGISIAEMVKTGAIPFVKNTGGQIEIVGAHNTDLFFSNDTEAMEKIVAVLGDDAKQQQLRLSLDQQKHLFSTQRFMDEVKKSVDQYFESPNPVQVA